MGRSGNLLQDDREELRELKDRLKNAEEIICSLRTGAPDAHVQISREAGDDDSSGTKGTGNPYLALIGLMHEGALILDSTGIIHFCNQHFANLVNAPVEKIVRSSIYQFITQSDREAFASLLQKGQKDEARIQLCLSTAAGHIVPVDVCLESIGINNGANTVCAVITDLSEQRRNEKILANVKLMRHILEEAAEIFIVCDERGSIIRASRTTEELLGRSPLAQHFNDVIPLLNPDGTPFNFPGIWSEVFPQAMEVCYCHEDGAISYFLLTARPFADKKRIVGLIIIMVDVTRHKLINRQLEERTIQLEEANRDLESFSYSISHDLRTPLRSIDNYARMILKQQGESFNEVTQNYFDNIRRNAKKMSQLIDDILSFSRLGSKELTFTQFEAGTLIKEAWEELQAAYPDRNMSLEIGALPPVCGDRSLMKQAFFNLLENAVKYTKYRDVARVEAAIEEGEQEVIFSIKDNGIGFDMACQDKLFGVFQRLHSSDDFEGTGVGLASVQRIISKHGGRIWAEGRVNEGACFYFTLPKHHGAPPPACIS